MLGRIRYMRCNMECRNRTATPIESDWDRGAQLYLRTLRNPQRSGGVAHSPIVLGACNWRRNVGIQEVGTVPMKCPKVLSGLNPS